ncbi:hypothetical protein OESDEN_17355 [Oesophagostomum dentatum]|uniref:Piwi domain-containing protein n=1 Tax=Oesophagostomum dentatum TaxID=61180 RepID=A0A0B1SIA0_OESDE|nr:hypothetical protein OESDEN_17355 [Oesophagostomum dentatum]
MKGGGAKTLENVLLKFNAKNKGLNHTVSTPRQALGRFADQRDMNARLFHAKMFVGFELSHAAAQSLFDRQQSIAVTEPTVVGVAEEAKEIRAVAKGISRELNNGRPYNPKITVVVAQTKSNYRMLPTSLPPPNSGRYKAQELNVPSGTCADTGIVNPQYREFIMASQHANIVSSPVLYGYPSLLRCGSVSSCQLLIPTVFR